MKNWSGPRFSIIIPTYNYGRYLPDAFDSIVEQQGDDYEVVIVDDGSTDDTAEVVGNENRLGNRLHYWHQPNKGLSGARNAGIAQAHGSYFLFLDADDLLLPEALVRFRTALAQQQDPDFSFGGYELQDLQGHIRTCTPGRLSDDGADNFARYMRKSLGQFALQAAVIHRRVFEDLPFCEQVRTLEDIVFKAHLLARYRGASFLDPVARIRRHSDSLSHRLDWMGQDRSAIVDIIFDSPLLPNHIQCLRTEFSSLNQLSHFRDLYRAGYRREACRVYCKAIRMYPANLQRWSYLWKYLRLLTSCQPRQTVVPSALPRTK